MAEPTSLTIDTTNAARASSQSRSQSQSLSSSHSAPPIAAAFWVSFDVRKGYTLTWHQSIDEVEIEGVVEFKALPSGLHNVEEDLVYFTHDKYVGVSAFVNKADEEAARNARMAAVGVLIRIDNGRMGRAWLHVEALKKMARNQVASEGDTSELEEYWEQYKLSDSPNHNEHSPATAESPVDLMVSKNRDNSTTTNGYQKPRSMSTSSAFANFNRSLAPHHPALALVEFLDMFGPLTFPLYRAALLRKRVLVVTEAPVEFACDLVYNISILASLPKALMSVLSVGNAASLRPRPLYNVGVADIDDLSRPKSSKPPGPDQSWIACTTDDVLATKPSLYDMLILLPRNESRNAAKRVYPKIVESSPELTRSFPKTGVKATLRDARRYGHLQSGLRRFPSGQPSEEEDEDVPAENASVVSNAPSVMSHKSIVEPATWSQVAYSSLVWWASAGDRNSGLLEAQETEAEQDLQLLFGDDVDGGGQTKEVALVGYFHRLTTTVFSVIADAVARADGDNTADDDDLLDDEAGQDDDDVNNLSNRESQLSNEQDGDDEQALLIQDGPAENVDITMEDMMNMGLDMWNSTDRDFVEQLVDLWWGRRATVKRSRIECCGMRIV